MSQNIRNFCIIAHIDHGKSTLADRMLEITGTIKKREGQNQVLDKMDIEQERGITIKLTPARMQWQGYELNLIDTPGHVDFQYEVSRSLASVEGAVLLVDASQGVQAQTLSTLYMALEYGLQIIPVLNKIDLPAANPERVAQELETLIGIDKNDIIAVSAKTGANVDKVLDAIIDRINCPNDFKAKSTLKRFYQNQETKDFVLDNGLSRALIFDSVYDKYRGVVAYVKVMDGNFKVGDKIKLVFSETEIQPTEVGYFDPEYHKDKILTQGQIGYIVTGQKSVRDAKIGDTMVFDPQSAILANQKKINNFVIPGFKKVTPYVYAGVYPVDTEEYEKLRDSFEKLSLNDSAVEYEYENSKALGHGFRAGFLGTLHMDIIKERLYREYDVETFFTIPNVIYLVKLKMFHMEKVKSGANISELIKSGLFRYILTEIECLVDFDEYKNMPDAEIFEKYSDVLKSWLLVRSGADLPDAAFIDEIWEPFSEVELVGPEEYSGNIMGLAQDYRGVMQNMEFIDSTRILWKYMMPLGEIIIDFYDRLKSLTKGYATMNYAFKKYVNSDLSRLDVFVNHDRIESFSMVVHKDKSYYVGKEIVEKLKIFIPKHLFPIPLQAGIGTKIIARETIPALKKDVLAKCYGGDVTRKRKLLAKQKEGKKKLKQIGKVAVPNDIFIKMLQR